MVDQYEPFEYSESQFGSESSNRFHCCFTIFLVGGLGSSCQLHAIKCEEVTFNKNPSLWDLIRSIELTIRTSSPYNLFIHCCSLKFSSIASMGMYFLGINLRVYSRVGGFGDCGEEFSWEPRVCMFNGLGREGRFCSRRRRLGVGSTGASR